jgi:uncharacterized protein YdeI (YjbR/CyaY-like superfamily)
MAEARMRNERMNRGSLDDWLRDGCGRCDKYATPACKVNRWRGGAERLIATLREAGLEEALKWGAPCFMRGGTNVVMVAAFVDSLALTFFRGGELDPGLDALESAGPNSHHAKLLRFKGGEAEVGARLDEVRRCVAAAIALADAGDAAPRPAPAPAPEVPAELAALLAAEPGLATAFAGLTPGRQRSHILHIAGAAQPATRARRAEKCRDPILAGRGFNERAP